MMSADKLYAQRNWNWGDKTIEIFASSHREGAFVRGKMLWEIIPEGAYSKPAVILDNTAAQKLMDTLWDCGIRPTEGQGSAGSLAATERHLTDMRRIAFDKLGIKTKNEVTG